MQAARRPPVDAVCTRPDATRFLFPDETGLRLDDDRTHGRAVGGVVPLQRGPARTLIGTLSVYGLGAVQPLDGALTQRRFAFYVVHCLAPTLRRGDVLVLDNLPVHKIGGLRPWRAEHGGEVVFLPPYSPDFSPIEQAWSKLKTELRTCVARSADTLQQAVRWITSQDAKN